MRLKLPDQLRASLSPNESIFFELLVETRMLDCKWTDSLIEDNHCLSGGIGEPEARDDIKGLLGDLYTHVPPDLIINMSWELSVSSCMTIVQYILTYTKSSTEK